MRGKNVRLMCAKNDLAIAKMYEKRYNANNCKMAKIADLEVMQ